MSRVSRLPRNSINDRPGRWKLLARRYRRFLRPMGWGVFGLAFVLLFAVLIHSKRSTDTLTSLRERLGNATAVFGLRVQTVDIQGRANTPEPLLRAALGVTKGAPILGFSVAAARQRIETLAWVEHATVERRLPSTIVVSLQERRPFAIWQNQGKFALIDRDGQIVADQNVAQFGQLPLVVGPGAPAAAAPLLDALTERPALQSHVVAAVRIGERRWNLHMDSGIDVLLPEGAEVAALDRLVTLQNEHSLLDRPLAVVDMRLPDRLVLRPLPDPQKSDPATGGHPPSATPRRPT
ncbi:MAG: cell division protein FtsQ/DivIB [Rhodospirillales bacterium]|nr:cell division protein FtsQ/DivIB [Rhodospirillales bacterium]